ncbi:MAG: guanylate kinase [Deltaproteobacteria bacterium]|jgi:guanylate kinase|nr:guanylate kinase [Deltaproteobacteria bacterium]
MQGKLVVISAPSGSGKSSLINALRADFGEDKIAYSVSLTTRPPRAGEIDGRDYHFVSQEEFDRMAGAGEFLEWTRTFGCSYGTSRRLIDEKLRLGVSVIADVDVVGASNIKAMDPDAVLVFIVPPSFRVLKKRLLARNTETPESMEERLTRVREELSYRGMFDFLVVNDQFNDAEAQLGTIITKGVGPPMEADSGFWDHFFD